MNKKSKKSKASAQRQLAVVARELAQPPRRMLSTVSNMVFRFGCVTAQSAASYSRGQLLSLLTIGYITTTSYRLIQSIRIKCIELWDPANGTGTPDNHANVTWLTSYSQRKVIDDATVGTAQAAYIKTYPPRNSVAAFPSEQGNNESEKLFGLTCGVGAILDLHVEITLASDQNTAMTAVTTTASATSGVISYWNLDGTSAGMVPTVELSRIS